MKKFRYLGCDDLGALLKYKIPVVIAVVIFTILDDLTVFVDLPILRAPSVKILVEADTNNLVGCEKAIFYALAE